MVARHPLDCGPADADTCLQAPRTDRLDPPPPACWWHRRLAGAGAQSQGTRPASADPATRPRCPGSFGCPRTASRGHPRGRGFGQRHLGIGFGRPRAVTPTAQLQLRLDDRGGSRRLSSMPASASSLDPAPDTDPCLQRPASVPRLGRLLAGAKRGRANGSPFPWLLLRKDAAGGGWEGRTATAGRQMDAAMRTGC